MQNTLPWASCETQYLNVSSVDCCSHLVAHSGTHPNCDTLVDASMSVYPFHTDQNPQIFWEGTT